MTDIQWQDDGWGDKAKTKPVAGPIQCIDYEIMAIIAFYFLLYIRVKFKGLSHEWRILVTVKGEEVVNDPSAVVKKNCNTLLNQWKNAHNF